MDLKGLLKLSGNDKCVECGDLKPSWGSIIVPPKSAPPDSQFIGCFICMHCSAAHRSLGTHICFVRSITLDEWTERDLEAMKLGGNLRVNSIFEGNMFDDSIRPTPFDDAQTREAFIKEKYINLKYFVPAAYMCVGTEEEDGDEYEMELAGEESHEVISVLASSSLQSRLAGGALYSSGSSSGGSGTVCSASVSTQSNHSNCDMSKTSLAATRTVASSSRREMMNRQSSLPTIRSPRMSLDEAFSNSSKNDFYESMNNSQWGNMTFEESLHTRTTFDLETKSTADAWNLSMHSPRGSSSSPDIKSEPSNREKMKGRRQQMLCRPKSARSIFTGGGGGGVGERQVARVTGSGSAKRLLRQSSVGQLPSCREEKKDDDEAGHSKASSSSTEDILLRLEKANRNRLVEQKSTSAPSRAPRRQFSAPVDSPRRDESDCTKKLTRSRSSEHKRRSKTKDDDDMAAMSISLSNLRTPTNRRRITTRGRGEAGSERLCMSCNFMGNATLDDDVHSPPPTKEREDDDPISLMLSPEVNPRRHRPSRTSSKSPSARTRLRNTTHGSICSRQSSRRNLSSKSPRRQPLRPASLHIQLHTPEHDTGSMRRINSLDAMAKAQRRANSMTDTRGNVQYDHIDIPPQLRLGGRTTSDGSNPRRSTTRTATTTTTTTPNSRRTRSKSPKTPRGRKAAVLKALNQSIMDEANSRLMTKEQLLSSSKTSSLSASSIVRNEGKVHARPRSLDISRRRKERRVRTKQMTALHSASDHPEFKGGNSSANEGDDDICTDKEDGEDNNGCSFLHRIPQASSSTSGGTTSVSTASPDQDSSSSFATNSYNSFSMLPEPAMVE
jgi:Putative GTPase activating protein for Arf